MLSQTVDSEWEETQKTLQYYHDGTCISFPLPCSLIVSKPLFSPVGHMHSIFIGIDGYRKM